LEEGARWMQLAIVEREPNVPLFVWHPYTKELRRSSRWQELVSMVNLSDIL
jgi:hypothetical protein